jgi:WD40 repeat protein
VSSGGLLAFALSALTAYFKPQPGIAEQRHGAGGGRVHAPGSPVRQQQQQQQQHDDGGAAAAVTAPGSPSSQHSGKTLVSCCSDGTLHVWRCGTGTCERSVPGAHRGRIHAACCLPPAQCVTAGDDATLRVWHVKSGTVLHTLEGHMAAVRCCCALQCGNKVVSGADDRSVCVWDVSTGAIVRTMEGHTGAVVHCATLVPASSGGSGGGKDTGGGGGWRQWGETRVVTGSVDASLRVWDTATGRCEFVLLHGAEDVPASPVRCGTTLPDGHILSGHDDGCVRVWHLPHWAGGATHGALAAAAVMVTGSCGVEQAASPVPHSSFAAITPDGAHIVSPDRTLRPQHDGPCTCICLVSNTRLASGGADGSVHLFSIRDFGCLAVLTAGGGPMRSPVTSLTSLHDGRFAVGAATSVALWSETALNTAAAVFGDHGALVTSVAHIESTKASNRVAGAAGSRALCGFDRLC